MLLLERGDNGQLHVGLTVFWTDSEMSGTANQNVRVRQRTDAVMNRILGLPILVSWITKGGDSSSDRTGAGSKSLGRRPAGTEMNRASRLATYMAALMSP